MRDICVVLHYSRAFKKVQLGKDQEKAQTEKDSHSKNRSGKKLQKKVQVGKVQEKAQSEKDSHSKKRGGKKPN